MSKLQQYRDTIRPINQNMSDYRNKFIVNCVSCNKEREVCYHSAINIISKKTSGKCSSCEFNSRSPEIDKKRKENARKSLIIRNKEANPSKLPETKEKMRLAKLGKTGELSNRWDGGFTSEKHKVRNRKIREYKKNRMKTDKVFYSMCIIRNRISEFIKGKKLTSRSKKLGCDLATFKSHIEAKFQPGMTWDNYGDWHIDHIFPLGVAAKISEKAFFKACHYTNLQPLWAIDNLKKGNKTNVSF